MRFVISLLLLCVLQNASAAACFDHGMPREACASALKAIMQFQSAGAKLPHIRIKWDKKGAIVPYGYYAYATMTQVGSRQKWTIAVNAHDMKWPRWEISLDKVFLHEIGHCLGWDHQPADSVMENPLYDHLTKQDLERIGGSQL